MSMSTYIQALIPDTDPTYKKHKKVLLACIEAELTKLPPETAEYFGEDYPDEELLTRKLTVELKEGVHFDSLNRDMESGYEIYINKLPKEICKIQVINSW